MKIKEIPQDFIVVEKLDIHIDSNELKYAIYELTKKQTNTIQAVDIITKKLNLGNKDIGFAGIKDKQAITTQIISIPNIAKAQVTKVLELSNEWIQLKHLGYCNRPVGTDMLLGNQFTIKVSGIHINHHNSNQKISETKKTIINYFGEQRFSIDNAIIGKAIVQKNFKLATDLLKGTQKTYNEKIIGEHLEKNPQDYVGALRKLPRQTLNLLIHAYQSLLWNKTIARILDLEEESKEDNYIAICTDTEKLKRLPQKIPLVGFFYEPSDWAINVQDTIAQILKEEQITPRDFINRQLTEATESGAVREVFTDITELQIKLLNQTQTEYEISFFLPKGSYATVALRFLAESQD
jgi:tRNA pseudouridine13 synthase